MLGNPASRSGHLLGQTLGQGRYELVELIGVGTYGEVYLTRDRLEGGGLYATKAIRKADFDTKSCSYSIEISLQRRLPAHPNVARLYFVEHRGEYVFMVMEYCPGGDLYDNIVNNPTFKGPNHDRVVRRVFLQLLDAVEHCHRHGVYHRDLKPENVLVLEDGRLIKLIDFGLATDHRVSTDIGCGSSYYMSPECQGGLDGLGVGYDTPANDVWSLGVILVNLASGRNPWNQAILSDPIFRAFVANPNFLSTALPITDDFNHIIQRVFTLDPAQRCTLPELRHLVRHCKRFMRPLHSTPAHAPRPSYYDTVSQPAHYHHPTAAYPPVYPAIRDMVADEVDVAYEAEEQQLSSTLTPLPVHLPDAEDDLFAFSPHHPVPMGAATARNTPPTIGDNDDDELGRSVGSTVYMGGDDDDEAEQLLSPTTPHHPIDVFPMAVAAAVGVATAGRLPKQAPPALNASQLGRSSSLQSLQTPINNYTFDDIALLGAVPDPRTGGSSPAPPSVDDLDHVHIPILVDQPASSALSGHPNFIAGGRYYLNGHDFAIF
ncbi:Serine/threonine protein kinase [Tieghemiomyces parasiticus]|uniref:Serine/threonine protein kinase n=1 Tax=Tieghemiomyces parasiticus TaxID=78921 RepID=A0A9W7ZPH5_9FUNG|nr:Serine/threonine protein kinase [Tieghemiomyces parasiticus]